MRIHTDHNGVYANAISTNSLGENVEGHLYYVGSGPRVTEIAFQRGAVQANGVNGLTNEALLAILIHRTEFLNSKFPCSENLAAIHGMRQALNSLEARTAARQARGVEGKEVA